MIMMEMWSWVKLPLKKAITTSRTAHQDYKIETNYHKRINKYGIHRIRNSVCVAGTKRVRDVNNDLTISIKQTPHSERYQALKPHWDAHPEVDEPIDTLGGSVILEAQSNYHKEHVRALHTTTYGSPVLGDATFSEQL